MRIGEKTVLIANASLFLFAAVSVFFLPETIVHHWGPDGPDRASGRLYILLIPLISAIVSTVSLSFSWWYERRDPADGEVIRYLMIMQCLMVAVCCPMGTLLLLGYNA